MNLQRPNGDRIHRCSRCGQELPLTAFLPRPAGSGFTVIDVDTGQKLFRNSWCAPCERAGGFNNRQRKRNARSAVVREGKPRLDSGPFIEWLKSTVPKYGNDAFAGAAGIAERSLHRILTEHPRTVQMDLVDRVLQNEGSAMLRDLYPELYELPDDKEAAA